jgi:polyisoprenoid-binding protein YceI
LQWPDLRKGERAMNGDLYPFETGTRPRKRVPASGSWVFDTVESRVQFSVRRMVVSRVRGQFTRFRGILAFDEAAPAESLVAVQIDSNSIETDDPDRDAHLRSADFLHAERFPRITFDSTRVEEAGEGRLRVKGILAIRGVEREVVLDAEYRGGLLDRWGNERLTFTGRTRFPRRAFGLTWNAVMPTGEVLVGEEIEVTMDIRAMRAPRGKA